MTRGFQTRFSTDPLIDALPGSYGPNAKIRSLKNSATDVAQVSTVAIGTVQASQDYTITLTPPDGTAAIAVTVNAASLTAAQLRNAVVTAIQGSRLFSYMIPAPSSTSDYTLTGRVLGLAYPLTISNTHASYTLTATTAAGTSAAVPFGRLVARKAAWAADVVALPTASDDILLGASVIDATSVRAGYGAAAVVSYGRNQMVSFTDDGDIYLEAETAVAANSTLLFRHTADGALNRLGVLAVGAGTGRAALPAGFIVNVLRPSLTLPSGQIVVYCRLLRS